MSKEFDPMLSLRSLSDDGLSEAREALIRDFSRLFPELATRLEITGVDSAISTEDLFDTDPFEVKPFAGVYKLEDGQVCEVYFGQKPPVDALAHMQPFHNAA